MKIKTETDLLNQRLETNCIVTNVSLLTQLYMYAMYTYTETDFVLSYIQLKYKMLELNKQLNGKLKLRQT